MAWDNTESSELREYANRRPQQLTGPAKEYTMKHSILM